MERVCFEDRNCSIARALDVLGDWWNVLIIREALWGTCKFDEFQRHLGMSKSILSKRLKLLLEHEILLKTANGFKHKHAFKSHILTKMSTKRKRQLRGSVMVHPSDVRKVDRMMRVR